LPSRSGRPQGDLAILRARGGDVEALARDDVLREERLGQGVVGAKVPAPVISQNFDKAGLTID
jgi:hypothetical protein